MGKTAQAMKISATWTPEYSKAAIMAEAAFRNTLGDGLRFEGGRIGVKMAIIIDMANPAHVLSVSRRIAEVKAHLESTGRLHSFNTSMGAVPIEEGYLIIDKSAQQEAA